MRRTRNDWPGNESIAVFACILNRAASVCNIDFGAREKLPIENYHFSHIASAVKLFQLNQLQFVESRDQRSECQ